MSGIIDFNAIAGALATRFSAVNVTAPTNETPIRTSTEKLPSQMPGTPAVLISLETVSFNYHASARTGTAIYHAKFYLERVRDTGRNATLLYKWVSALYGQVDGQIHLGLSSYVNWAEVTATNPGVLTYAGESYEGIDLQVTVHLGEGISPVA